MGPDWGKQSDGVYIAEWKRIISGPADVIYKYFDTHGTASTPDRVTPQPPMKWTSAK